MPKKKELQQTKPLFDLQLDDPKWAALIHLSAFLGFIIPVVGQVLGPWVIWMFKKGQSSFLNETGRQVLNFQLSCSIYFALGLALGILSLWLIFPIFLFSSVILISRVIWSIFIVIGTIRASQGQVYTYPLTIRFLK